MVFWGKNKIGIQLRFRNETTANSNIIGSRKLNKKRRQAKSQRQNLDGERTIYGNYSFYGETQRRERKNKRLNVLRTCELVNFLCFFRLCVYYFLPSFIRIVENVGKNIMIIISKAMFRFASKACISAFTHRNFNKYRFISLFSTFRFWSELTAHDVQYQSDFHPNQTIEISISSQLVRMFRRGAKHEKYCCALRPLQRLQAIYIVCCNQFKALICLYRYKKQGKKIMLRTKRQIYMHKENHIEGSGEKQGSL